MNKNSIVDMYRCLYLLLFFTTYQYCFCQISDLKDISNHGDCNNAIKIEAKGIFGPTTAPEGFGEVLEIKDNKLGNKYYFEQEHNTVWYKFTIEKDQELLFDIIPENVNDDYDFLLFKLENDEFFFCNYGVKNKIVRPIRTNISRNKPSVKSMTGLNESATNEYVISGIGSPYSKMVNVKAGEKYYLVVDNVYDNGSGHTIIFNGGKYYKLEGKVVDNSTGSPIKAEISLEDYKTGKIIAKTESKTSDGSYTLRVPVDSISDNNNYNVSVFAEKYFFDDQIIKGKEIMIPKPKGLVTKLERLAKGKSLSIRNILFYGNEARVLISSRPYLRRIYKLMKRNKSLVIQIEGHTNGCGATDPDSVHDNLSKARAETVYNYLIENGIKKNRLSTIGYGKRKMLYPTNANTAQMQANRRVEIKIIEY